MKKNKDNPVSSIDINKYKKFLVKRGYNKNGPIIKAMINPLKEFIKQNDVTSNKEYPNKGNEVL